MSSLLSPTSFDSEGPPSRRRILTIDDNEKIHDDYRKVLIGREGNSELEAAEAFLFGEQNSLPNDSHGSNIHYEIDSAHQGRQGLDLVKAAIDCGDPYQAAFIDVRMPPGWDGIETTRRIWEVAPDLPIVLCTAYSDHSWEEVSAQLPKADQFLILKKPFDPIELRQMAASQTTRFFLNRVAKQNHENLREMVDQRVQEIAITRDLVFFALARLAESRDLETGEHLSRIQTYVRLLIESLRDESAYQDEIDDHFIEAVCRSSVLHDIGKVGVPDQILLKPGKLTPDEFDVMKTHVEIGARALEDASRLSPYCNFLKTAADIARYHHERYDGTGYPAGLAGDETPLAARIVAVADVFDALTSKRIYKDAMHPDDAKQIIEMESGAHFDPEVVRAFIRCWDQFREFAIEGEPVDGVELATLETCNELREITDQAVRYSPLTPQRGLHG